MFTFIEKEALCLFENCVIFLDMEQGVKILQTNFRSFFILRQSGFDMFCKNLKNYKVESFLGQNLYIKYAL